MLEQYLDNLKTTIQWAHYRDDLDVLSLARTRMDQLQAFVQTLPPADQARVQQRIERVLPMEWPLWMEACRYGDGDAGVPPAEGRVLH